MTKAMKKTPRSPHETDVLVGARLRQRRIYLGMNQSSLAALLGITFQQVQKYEHGTNRMSAGLIRYIAELLEVPVEWFFSGESDDELDREGIELLALYHQLPPEVAARFLALMQAAGGAA